jgi:CPA2 family monovalent cation:H+ antiporter-2
MCRGVAWSELAVGARSEICLRRWVHGPCMTPSESEVMTGTLTDILLVLAVAVVVTLLFSRVRLPGLVGLFVAGALIGPNALGLVSSPESVEHLAEVGVIFLLFALGLEFSFKRMARLARVILIAGPLQVILTGAIGFGVGSGFGLPVPEATVLGMLVALSSTAVVLKTMTERGEVDTPLGRNALGILIFQDVLVVPLMLILPLLAGREPQVHLSAPVLVAIAIGVILLTVVFAKWVVPWVLHEAARSRSADIFLMVVVAICFAVAALSARLGLSLALGAFLAGLIISESEYSHHALGLVMPFRNLLVSFFFVSVGMLLDPSFLADYWWMVLLGVIGLMLVKTVTGTIAAQALRYPLRVSLGTGLALNQVGEFSFVLAAVATSNSLLTDQLRQGFLGVAVLTMALTPIVISLNVRVSRLADRLRLPGWLLSDRWSPRHEESIYSDHLLIIGYGMNGRNLARTARECGFPYAVVEMNPQTVRREVLRSEPIHFGDATNEMVLLRAGVTRAKAAAVVIGDASATRGIVAQLRRLNPELHIIARTRFVSEVEHLYELGANDVIPEEFESSVATFRRTAEHFALPEECIRRLETSIREDQYAVLRGNGQQGEDR